jgi:hypothetical protein
MSSSFDFFENLPRDLKNEIRDIVSFESLAIRSGRNRGFFCADAMKDVAHQRNTRVNANKSLTYCSSIPYRILNAKKCEIMIYDPRYGGGCTQNFQDSGLGYRLYSISQSFLYDERQATLFEICGAVLKERTDDTKYNEQVQKAKELRIKELQYRMQHYKYDPDDPEGHDWEDMLCISCETGAVVYHVLHLILPIKNQALISYIFYTNERNGFALGALSIREDRRRSHADGEGG